MGMAGGDEGKKIERSRMVMGLACLRIAGMTDSAEEEKIRTCRNKSATDVS